MKYIDAEKLKAKIKELNLVTKTYDEQVAFNNALAMVMEIIASLQQEQPEVDLEKEVQAFLCNYDYEFDDDPVPFDIAKHFYELGLKTR